MRKVAAYSLQSRRDCVEDAEAAFQDLDSRIGSWLKSKGLDASNERNQSFKIDDGRELQLQRARFESNEGQLEQYSLREPTSAGLFQTTVALGQLDAELSVFVELRTGALSSHIQPLQYDVRCPKIVRDILDSGGDWYVGDVIVSTRPVKFLGLDSARSLIRIIFHESRNLPVVAVSPHQGQFLTESFPEDLARDLSGLAIVAEIDSSASWGVTSEKGKAWSCYNGAVRLYWPVNSSSSNPFDHPLWTQNKLLGGSESPTNVAYRLRSQLRRRILGLSAFSVVERPFLRKIRQAARLEEIKRLKAESAEQNEWQQVAELYATENDDLELKLEERNAAIRDLQQQLSNVQSALSWSPNVGDVCPDSTTPPTTVADAVSQARDTFADNLIFGSDVDEGVAGLSDDAGPPEKILSYLESLSMLTETRKRGGLGTTEIAWLKERGIDASIESETIRQSQREKKKRTWNDGQASRYFEHHLKPSDATSPDRCVRIYYEFDDDSQKTIVGWVGRHP